MHTLGRREDGTAAVELGIILPLLMVFLAFVAPLVKFGYDYMGLQRVAAHGVRFASRADANARVSDDGSSFTRRPSAGEVKSFIADSSNGKVTADQITVSPPNPALALPGEQIVVSIDHEFSYGALADIANSVKSAFFGGGAFLPPQTVTVSARGREE